MMQDLACSHLNSLRQSITHVKTATLENIVWRLVAASLLSQANTPITKAITAYNSKTETKLLRFIKTV